MIGSELFDKTPILIKIRYIKTFDEFRMSSEKNNWSLKGESEQFLHNTDCFSPLCCEIYTKDEIRVLQAAEASRAWKDQSQSPRLSFARKSRSHRECRDLWVGRSSFSILSSTSVLSPVLSLSLSQLPPAWSCALPEKEMNFALELFLTMIDITFVIAMMMFFKKEILSRKTVTSSWIFFARLRKES